MTILDGKKIAMEIRDRVKKEIAALDRAPGLGVVLVGDDPASHTYVRLKERACHEVGIVFEKTLLPASAPQPAIVAAVDALNARADIDAVLVQLPLPAPLDADAVVQAIDPAKDVDGFHPENIAALLAGTSRLRPVIVNAMFHLFDAAGTTLTGKRAVLFANSAVFADPLRAVLEADGARVEVVFAGASGDPAPLVRTADIVISAVGRPRFLRAVDCRDGALVIDVGTNWLPDGGYVGDVDAAGAEQKPGWITPVPGGVGPVTVAALTENVLALSRSRSRG